VVLVDNDDSLDLDQLSVAEDLGGGTVKILIAVADVDALIAKTTPIDQHAAGNTARSTSPATSTPCCPKRCPLT